jgi:hypothetical protein
LKQVEVALLEYNPTSDTWTLSAQNQAVVGGVDPTPLNQFYSQSDVKCERPDVIAVGDWFSVAWTRIYDRDYDGGALYGTAEDQTREPSVLECAWIRKVNGVMQVYTGNGPQGQGWILDADSGSSIGPRFWVRECAGCPDLVMLHPGDAGAVPPILPTVGVVYPHETNFGDFDEITGAPGGDGARWFELRLATCSIDPTTFLITSTKYPPIVASSGTTGIRYDGPADAAGIVLPDVAPASVPWRFGLAYEEQVASPVMTGRIQLQTWAVDPPGTGVNLAMLESHAFGGPASPAFRRRAILASYPAAFPGRDVFAIAFNLTSSAGEGDIFYQEWDLTDGAQTLLWIPGWGWDNDADHRKPFPLLGRELSYQTWFGICFGEESNGGSNCDLLKYIRKDSQFTDQRFTITTADELQRPAAAYHYDGVHDNVALTWEQATPLAGGGSAVRVWLRME